MTRHEFHHMHGQVMQIADLIYNGTPAPTVADHVRLGHALLASRMYAEAAHSFTEAIAADPACADAHFGLALALLQGKRPHRHGTATIRRVQDHLRAAAELVEARVLELLVVEDDLLAWRRASGQIPLHVMAMAMAMSAERANLILMHVPAPEARTWRAIELSTRRSR